MQNLPIKSIDVMKKTKDSVTAQLSDAEILDLITRILDFQPTHIALSQQMDTTAQFIANGTTPSPRTNEAHIQKWCDTIHNAGVGVMFRGTFCGIESIWGFPFYQDGSGNFLPQGTVASAPTDGETTWLGRIWRFITANPNFWQSGDIFAPIPEPTTHAFDGHFFIAAAGGATNNFATFFNNLVTVSTNAFANISKTGITVGYTQNNYSEIASGWIPNSVFSAAGITGTDYYGNYNNSGQTPDSYVSDLNIIFNSKGRKVMQGEWGDLSTAGRPVDERNRYVISLWKHYTEALVNSGKLIGYNYWGGWEAQNTSLLYKDTNGKYQLNSRGKILASFYRGSGMSRVPVVDANGNY